MEDVISAHQLDCVMYADDTQLYVTINSFSDRSVVVSKLELCIKDILIWCTSNGLACNPGKTEIVHLTSRYTKQCPILGIAVDDIVITPKPAARDLGVILDSHLQLTKHINNICKSASLAIRNIGKIRKHLTQENCERLVHAFITRAAYGGSES